MAFSCQLAVATGGYGRILQEADGSRLNDADVQFIASISSDPAKVPSITTSNVSKSDLEAIGVKTSAAADIGLDYLHTGDLVASCISSLSASAVDTLGELNTIADAANSVMHYAAEGKVSYSDGDWINALSSMGIKGVSGLSSSAVTSIKDAIHPPLPSVAIDPLGTQVDTYDELQAIVSLVRVNDYAAQNSDNQLPTLADYAILAKQGGGVYTDAKSNYLASYNSATFADSAVSLALETHEMILAYNQILDAADGNRNATPLIAIQSDFAKLFVTIENSYAGTGVSGGGSVGAAQAVGLLDDVISGLSTDKVDTVAKLQDLEEVVGKLMSMAANTKTSGATSSDYSGVSQNNLGLLGLKGGASDSSLASSNNVTSAELTLFCDELIYTNHLATAYASGYSVAELQRLLNNAIAAA